MEKVKYRHELKHYINLADCAVLQSKLKFIMKPDTNGGAEGNYLIRSLYFDSPDDKALMEKITGICNREKFRIRFYNHNDSFIRLEKKVKVNSLTAKFSAAIPKKQCMDIVNGDIEWMKASEKPLLQELYRKMKHERLMPKTIVDYRREAYVYKAGNVRVTIDKSIKTGLFSTDIFDKDLKTVDALDRGIAILEVKYDEFLPELINDIIQVGDRRKASASKYALCRMYG